MRLAANFTADTVKARITKKDIYHVIKYNYNPRLLYPTKLPVVHLP